MMKNVKKILKSLNVLYAEDNDTMRVNTSKTLELFCNKVFQMNNGADALETFKKEPIHIVILDYVMPRIDGYNVALEIRKQDKDIPIFITSSYTEKEKLLNVIGLNLIGYLEKPIALDELMQTLTKCVDMLMQNHKLTSSLGEGVQYNYMTKNLIVEDKDIQLTKNEYQFIELLLKYKPSLLSFQDIEDSIFSDYVDINTIRNMVYRVRKKIGKDVITTIKDMGYTLNNQ